MGHDEFVIHGGRVIDPAQGISQISNVFVKDGFISEISGRTPAREFKKIDASGLCVAHGFIDLHTHLREPGFEGKEDIESGGRAAAAGGFTTILCMPNTEPVNDCADVTKFIIERARKSSSVNILPVGAETKGLFGKEIADFEGMIRKGIVAVSDDGGCVQDDNVMRRIFETAVKKGLLVISHPEDFSISRDGVINEGEVSRRLGLPGILREAENRIIARDIALAREAGARLHVAHVSTVEGIELVRKAKGEGARVTCEVTPHHLLLTDDAVESIGANAKMKPPLRTEADRQALIEGLRDMTVDAIATDHAPHMEGDKKNLRDAEFGVIGMETAFPVCMKIVKEGRITLERLIELLTSGPAKVLGIAANLAAGQPADIVIFDPAARFKIDARKFCSKSRNTPFDGWETRGKIVCTIVGGRV